MVIDISYFRAAHHRDRGRRPAGGQGEDGGIRMTHVENIGGLESIAGKAKL